MFSSRMIGGIGLALQQHRDELLGQGALDHDQEKRWLGSVAPGTNLPQRDLGWRTVGRVAIARGAAARRGNCC